MGRTLTAPLRLAAHMGIVDPDAPLLIASAGSPDPEAQIACAARLGFAGITDNGLKARPAAVQRAMGEALRAHGLEMGTFTHCVLRVDPPFYWGAPIADMAEAMADALDAADRIGGGCINIVLLDNGAPPGDQLTRATDNLALAGGMAAACGVALAVERVSPARLPGALDVGVDTLAALARRSGIGLILDSCHCQQSGEDMAAAILAHRAVLATVQLADMPGRVEPGAGTIDFAPIVAALRTIGWRGLVEAELMPATPGRAGEAAAVAALMAL